MLATEREECQFLRLQNLTFGIAMLDAPCPYQAILFPNDELAISGDSKRQAPQGGTYGSDECEVDSNAEVLHDPRINRA